MDFLEILRSPCCYAKLEMEPFRMINDLVYSGELVCQQCRSAYPVVRGVLYLSFLNPNWDVILQELISRRNITQRNMESLPDVETNYRRQEQEKIATDIMDSLFNEVWEIIRPQKGMRILDVGAGEGRTTERFAEAAESVIATDTDPSGLHHINFSKYNLPPPRQYLINQHRYYQYSPTPTNVFFQCIIAPAEHLPFAANSFDITFCRSTLHHLSRLQAAIREMVRVTKAGGQLIFCSEPIRSILDREEFYLEGIVDREEGLNERCPHLFSYLMPFIRERAEVRVQYWRRTPAPTTQKFISLLPINWEQHFCDGELAQRRKLLKLFFTSASINIYAVKKKPTADEKPASWDCEKIEPIDAVAEIYGRRDFEESVKRFAEDTEDLMRLRRKILGVKKFNRSDLTPHKRKAYQLWQGWGKKFFIANRYCRVIYNFSLCTLKKTAADRFLNIVYFSPDATQRRWIMVKINNVDLGKYFLLHKAWQSLKIPLPEKEEGIVDIRFKVAPPIKFDPTLVSAKIPAPEPRLLQNVGLFIHRIFFSKQ